jgi:hypothetical protein
MNLSNKPNKNVSWSEMSQAAINKLFFKGWIKLLSILESMDKRALTIDCAATFHHIMPTEQKREQTGTKLI